MRDYDSHYGFADSVNRRAFAALLVGALVLGVAFAAGALRGEEASPDVSVLAADVISERVELIDITAAPGEPNPEQAVAPTTTTVDRPITPASTTSSTTSTTTLPATTTTSRPTTTTVPTTTTTTTTVPPTTTTTLPPTTTTTTPPTTTTTTAPPVIASIHIDRFRVDTRSDDDGSFAEIQVRVKNDTGQRQRGVLVLAQFKGGWSGLVSGTTNNRGDVVLNSGPVEGDSVTFTVLDLQHPDYVYDPEQNTVGPSITVTFD
ncbi:MAG: hypothetical protein ACR2OI_13590 [Acidimicrobiia bacterium]